MTGRVSLAQRAKALAGKAVEAVAVRIMLGSRLRKLTAELETLQREVRDLQAGCGQLEDIVEELGGMPPPPRHLQIRVVGCYVPDFLKSGKVLIENMNDVLARANTDLRSFGTILDFGCGCGRVVRALRAHALPSQVLHATDIDPEAIAWCSENYRRVAQFGVNGAQPPLAYADDTFDFIYSISIFTHLPEDMQTAWLRELHRVAKPGAYLLLSVHGKNHFHNIPPEQQDAIRTTGFCYRTVGDTEGLPSFYQVAYHSQDYIRARWSEYFEIVDVQEVAISNWQDAVLCRKRTA